jgi:hypothetical protein
MKEGIVVEIIRKSKKNKSYGICWKVERHEGNLPKFRPEKFDSLTIEMPQRHVSRAH